MQTENSHIPLPPQALDMEAAVLGALLLERDAFYRVSGFIKPEMFYKDGNKYIYEAILELKANSQNVDILTVKELLKKSGKLDIVGGALYLTQLTQTVAGSANIEAHAKVIAEKYILRKTIETGNEMIRGGYAKNVDPFDFLDRCEQNLFALSQQSLKKDFVSISELTVKTLEEMESVMNRPGGIAGIPSGLTELDKMLSGFQKTDLVILAARPAMGKTALALHIAKAVSYIGSGVGFFSLEMGEKQLTQRIIVSEAEIQSQKVRNGTMNPDEWQKVNRAAAKVSNLDIYIDDTPALSIHELRTKARKLKSEKDISILIVDYLQLMSGIGKRGQNREQEISSISRGLKVVAKELDICVIALSQLSRAVETRGGNKQPMLSDLRESGAIEQDADVVMFLYRPEYYGFESDDEGNSTLGLAEIIISKQRNGPTGIVKTQFIKQYGKFADWSAGIEAFGQDFQDDMHKIQLPAPSDFNGYMTDPNAPF